MAVVVLEMTDSTLAGLAGDRGRRCDWTPISTPLSQSQRAAWRPNLQHIRREPTPSPV